LRAQPREMLRQLSPEAVLTALTTGKMQAQGSSLTDAERRAVAEYASGSLFGAPAYGSASTEKPNLCEHSAPLADFKDAPGWNGWGNGLDNLRFQPAAAAGLSAADLPKLKLKWAFGYANTVALRAQPAVFGHRVFVANDAGEIYALDAKTGCTYWTYKAKASVTTAPLVAPYKARDDKSGYAVYFADRSAYVYALDAQSGGLVWGRKVEGHPHASITGAPALYDGVLFVPVQGADEEDFASNNNNYRCCTFRGSVVALDSNTGTGVWKNYTMAEPKPREKSSAGVQMFGPSGGGIWSAPSIDPQRGVLYVGTGNGYSDPPQPTTDAIIAMDLKTGEIRWMKQVAGPPDDRAKRGADYDFSASPVLVHANGRDLLIAAQKSGVVYALDPDKQGEIVWKYRFGKGSALGGQWGIAVEAQRFFIGTADLLTAAPGGMHGIEIANGKPAWKQPPQPGLCLKNPGQACSAGQGSAPTAIPGAALSAGLDGGLRAYSTRDGSILWLFDTNRDFETINGVVARGGAMDRGGAVVVDGMVYVNSGYGGVIGHPGNVLLAFGLD
jgi:polyvinyl alcohol dehydrogenase (cytochrome)